MDFIPATSGTNSGSLVLSDNSLNATSGAPATQSVALSGTGIPLLGFAAGNAPATPIALGGNAGIVNVNELDASSAVITLATDLITLAVTGPTGYTASYGATAVSGVATFDLSAIKLPRAGNYSYVASLTAVTGSPTASATENVNTVAPGIAVALTGGVNNSAYGTALTFTATVTGPSGAALPTGTATFKDSAAILACSGVGDNTLTAGTTSSTATCTISSLTGGPHSITASYVPGSDPNYAAAGPSTALPQSVTPLATTVALSSSAPVSSIVNGSVTFTATVTYSTTPLPTLTPTGTMAFTLNSNPIANCTAVPINGGGTWTCAVPNLIAPSDTIGATYSGDGNFATSIAPPLSQTVNPASPTLTLTPSPASSTTVGQTVTFTAALGPLANLSPIAPTGSISFTVNGSSSPDCPAKTLTGGATSATCITSGLVWPSDVIRATYTGDTNFNLATAAPLTEIVAKAIPQVTVVSSASPAVVNQSLTFTATLAPPRGAARGASHGHGHVSVERNKHTGLPCSADLEYHREGNLQLYSHRHHRWNRSYGHLQQ